MVTVFQSCTLTRLGLSAFCQNEKERTHPQTVILRSLSYMRCRCREALCAAFRCSAFKTARRPDVCRFRGHREEMNSPVDKIRFPPVSLPGSGGHSPVTA